MISDDFIWRGEFEGLQPFSKLSSLKSIKLVGRGLEQGRGKPLILKQSMKFVNSRLWVWALKGEVGRDCGCRGGEFGRW